MAESTTSQGSSRSAEIRPLILVLVVAFALRLILAFLETEVGIDSVHYILMGDNIAHGRSFDTWNTTGGRWLLPPTFPLLVALFRLMGAGLEWSGQLAAITAGTFLLIPLYFLTRRLFTPTTALIAVWIAAFYPILVDYSVVILTENLFAALVLSMLVFLHRSLSEKGTLWDSFRSGVFLGLAFLTKTFGIFLLLFLALSYMFGRGGRSKLSPAKQLGFSIVGFLILAVPYWTGLHQYTGRWVIDGKGEGQAARIFATSLDDEHIDPRYSGELTPDGTDFEINVNPSGLTPQHAPLGELALMYPAKYLRKLIRIYQDFPYTPTYPNNVLLLYLFPSMLLGLGIFTGGGRWTERHSDRFLLYWLCPFVFGIPLVFVEVRYYIPVVPLLVPFMARGIEEVAGWMVERFSGVWKIFEKGAFGKAIAIVIAVFILLALPKLTYKITHWSDPMVSYNPRKVAAQWLLAYDYHPKRIMEYGHSVSFYSDAQSILIPQGDLHDVIRIARKYDVEFLSLDEFYVLRAHRRPEIEFLFDTDLRPPPELERLYLDPDYPGLKHVIYRIRTPEEIAKTFLAAR